MIAIQQRMSWRQTIVALLLTLCLAGVYLFVGWWLGYYWGVNPLRSGSLAQIIPAYHLVSQEFLGEVNEERLKRMTLSGMLAGLNDPYSYYLSPEEVAILESEDAGVRVGLGFSYVIAEEYLLVATVFPESPANKAGLVAGAHVVAIDQQLVSGLKNEGLIRAALKGKAGDTRKLTVLDKKDQPVELTIPYEEYPYVDLSYQSLPDNVGLITAYGLGPTVELAFEPILTRIKEEGRTGLVLDLRNVTGGRNDQDVFLLRQFISEGILLRETDARGKEMVWEAFESAPLESISLVVVVNQQTGSAAEVVTAVLQEKGRATIVGKQTYGKGVRQSLFRLTDGSAVSLTNASWTTPDGATIDGVGVVPDIEVEDDIATPEDEAVEAGLVKLFQ